MNSWFSQEQSDDWVAIWIFLVGRFFTRVIDPVYRKFLDAAKKLLLPTLMLLCVNRVQSTFHAIVCLFNIFSDFHLQMLSREEPKTVIIKKGEKMERYEKKNRGSQKRLRLAGSQKTAPARRLAH